MLNIVNMTVNGKAVEIAVDPRENLVDTLRNRLGLESVKRGCEVGECGACTVLIDGEAVDSCLYLSIWAEGKSILTVEGIKGPNGELSPIQKAFVLCRCTGYENILNAMERIVEETYRVVGKED